MQRDGYPAYTTSAGWLGYSDDKVRRLTREAVRAGLDALQDQGRPRPRRRHRALPAHPRGDRPRAQADDRRQPGLGRGEAIAWMKQLARVRAAGGSRSRPRPTTCWATPRSRKALSRSASASPPARCARTASSSSSCCRPSAIGFCQIDSCRLGGVNEILAVMLMAAKFGVPVCPHAGGVGLCEYVQHLSIFDYICVSAHPRGSRDRIRRPPARALRGSGA